MSRKFRKNRNGRTHLKTGAALLSATTLLVAGCSSSSDTSTEGSSADAASGTVAVGDASAGNAVDFETIVDATIRISGQGTFIEPGQTSASESAWQGSGFIIDPSGIAITNNHVVVGAGRLDATFGEDGKEKASVKVLGASECLDLAVVQLNSKELPYFDWFEGDITTGLDVFSAGYPVGAAEEFTLTRGIVSKADFEFDTLWASLDQVIEHDARIRGGNSGGPLITSDAKVVGVNYAGDDSLDYSFAIHRDVAQQVFEDLKNGERISSIGINASAWDSGDPEFFGVWVNSVEAGGPADKAGIKPGDLILKLAGVSVGDQGTLASYCQVLDTHGSDGTMDVEILRPSDGSLMAGQINGRELEVTQENVTDGSEAVAADGYSGETVDVSDDSNSIAVTVPVEWAEIDGAGFSDDSGRDWSSLAISTDLNAFFSGFDAPGVWMLGTDPSLSTGDALAQFDPMGSCSQTDQGPWDDGYYRGEYIQYDCAGTTVAVLATQDYEATGTLVVLLKLHTEYELTTVLEEIAATFRFL
ncbi:trypsin-like peptidase domain-containing protein [Corynebacterium callunae]|uniref:S1C family serine protease n=1 Tax=Corynebacterium callunae TaxID=1721 RepID=UPI003982091A